MQIQCTFNDYEELENFVVNYAGRMIARSIVEGSAKEQLDKQKTAQKPVEPAKAEKPKKDTPKATEAKDEAPVNAPKGVETEVPKEFKALKDETPKAEKIDESSTKVLLAGLIKNGKKAEVKALLEGYGVGKLSELMEKCPEKLEEFYRKAEAL